MNYSYLTNINYNAGIYIRLSQEDKDKKYINLNISSNEDKRALVEYIVSIDKEVTKLIKTIIRELKKDMAGYFQRRRYD